MTHLNYENLKAIGDSNREHYLNADPFPSIVLDEFLSEGTIENVLTEYPSVQADLEWRNNDAQTSEGDVAQAGKFGYSRELQLGPTIRSLLWELNSSSFLKFLEQLTGIKNLLPDPHMEGGGLHQILPGGSLMVHADFNRHPAFGLERRLNALFYLNQDWEESYGGHLELWKRDMSECSKRVLPVAGRCVIFNTDSTSYHGHPEPLTCPEGRTRKSIALYYYTNGLDGVHEPGHSTLWQKRPGHSH